jgi:hypothetical protein
MTNRCFFSEIVIGVRIFYRQSKQRKEVEEKERQKMEKEKEESPLTKDLHKVGDLQERFHEMNFHLELL